VSSYRIRTPKRDTTTYDRTVAQARQQPVVRARPSRRRMRLSALWRGVSFARGGWRWVSGLLSLTIGAALAIILTTEVFYVSQVEVGGLRTVPAEEIFAASGVADYHIFWIKPDAVARAVADAPGVATANVRVYWPARVIIQVTEREPALIWEQGGTRYWVDVRGNLMPQRRDLPNLIRIYSEGEAIPVGCPGPDCPGDVSGRVSIERDVVEGALQLKTRRADIELLYYDPISGLSFNDERGWRAYFGVGTDMGRKLLIYDAIVADLQTRGLRPEYIDVSNAQAPVYRLTGVPEQS
jgi:hypothetical protein